MWPDIVLPEHSSAHIASLKCLLCAVDDDALLKAWRVLKTRGQSSTRTRFQAQVVHTWISCQAVDGSIISLTSENVKHHWFSERIVRICQKKLHSHVKVGVRAECGSAHWDTEAFVHGSHDGLLRTMCLVPMLGAEIWLSRCCSTNTWCHSAFSPQAVLAVYLCHAYVHVHVYAQHRWHQILSSNGFHSFQGIQIFFGGLYYNTVFRTQIVQKSSTRQNVY